MTDFLPIEAVLFDLDGTLLDTAPDMAAALNRLLAENEREAMPYDRLRPVVSHGAKGLLTAGFGPNLPPDDAADLTRRFLDLYAENIAVGTTLFDGMREVLYFIEARGLRWGIVTNKPGWLTDKVLEELDILPRPGCVIAGDTLPERKPHPAPLEHAADLLEICPTRCVYVGDAERDIQAGRAAGMRTLIAGYGYIEAHEVPHAWQADGRLDHPLDLNQWLDDAAAS